MQRNGLLGLSVSISLALASACRVPASLALVVSPLTAVTTTEKMAGATAMAVQAPATAPNRSGLSAEMSIIPTARRPEMPVQRRFGAVSLVTPHISTAMVTASVANDHG